LRASLKDLLFKDGSFRWNRLENLLRNARGSSDYDLSQVVDQTLDYLFSDRGDLIRRQIVEEAVKGLDLFGNATLNNIRYGFAERLGLNVNRTTVSTDQPTLEHLKRIWGILKETQGFDPAQLLPVIPKLLFKPEAHQMGQQIAGGLAQRAIARFIREFLLTNDADHANQPSKQLRLPAAHL